MSNATEENRQVQTDTPETRPIKRHATWCDPVTHALAEAESVDGIAGCIGRPIYTTIGGGRDIGGWWRQAEGQQEPDFAAEWDLKYADLSINQILSLYKLFMSLSWQDVSSVATMLGSAIDQYEGGDAWRDRVTL